MGKKARPVIAVNEESGIVRRFPSEYAMSMAVGVSCAAIQHARRLGTTTSSWRVFDTSEGIRQRIQELKDELVYVQSLEDELIIEMEAEAL